MHVEERHTEAQMIGALKQLEAGRKAEDVAREVGPVRVPDIGGSIMTCDGSPANG